MFFLSFVFCVRLFSMSFMTYFPAPTTELFFYKGAFSVNFIFSGREILA